MRSIGGSFLPGSEPRIIISGAAVIHTDEAWGLEVKNLKPETMRTLIKMARDIYPHDRLADRFYAVAMKSYDVKAGTDPQTRTTVEQGVAQLDALARKQHGVAYADVGWEADRVALLRQIERDEFFQNVRGGLSRVPLQPEGGVADVRLRGRIGFEGRLHQARFRRHRLAVGRAEKRGGIPWTQNST